MAEKKDYKKRIVIDPKVHFGKPCIAGTRICSIGGDHEGKYETV